MALQVGDVVWLKSGGPAMTVKTVRDDEVWTTYQGETGRGVLDQTGGPYKEAMLTNQHPQKTADRLTEAELHKIAARYNEGS